MTSTQDVRDDKVLVEAKGLDYQTGFGNQHKSEAIPGTLPVGRNSPQRVAFGLYAEQMNGTGFTEPRATNRRSWLYRIRPSVMHPDFTRIDNGALRTGPFTETEPEPNSIAWGPIPDPAPGTDFVAGLRTTGGFGSPGSGAGLGIHWYSADTSMTDRVFSTSDGELAILPVQGELLLHTEFGKLHAAPGHLVLIPRAVKFRVELLTPGHVARGAVFENYGAPFALPDLGLIGANGLADPRDFEAPHAAYEDIERPYEVVHKLTGNLWSATYDHSPLDVVAWHGNHVPYRYDLRRFQIISSTTYDHTDPSIYTVLTSPGLRPGAPNIDLIATTSFWWTQTDTMRWNYFHRNVSPEYAVRIAPPEGTPEEVIANEPGLQPGWTNLVNTLTPHGPPPELYQAALTAELVPERLDMGITLALETPRPIVLTRAAAEGENRLPSDADMWNALNKTFTE
jgi:homogentisate 1,2-dioxygenase